MLQFVPLAVFAAVAVSLATYSDETVASQQWSTQLSLAQGHIAVADALVRAASSEPDETRRREQLEEALRLVEEVIALLEQAPHPVTNEEAIAYNDTMSNAKRTATLLRQELSGGSSVPTWAVIAACAVVGLGLFFGYRKA